MNFIKTNRKYISILKNIHKNYNLSVIRCSSNEIITEPKKSCNKHYDIIIVGGGMVGSAMACALSNYKTLNDKSVLLLDGAPPFKYLNSEEYSNRVLALNKGTKTLFKSMGVWELITSRRFKPVKKMVVWDALSNANIKFNPDNLSDDMCYIVEQDLIVDSLLKILSKGNNTEIKCGTKIKNCVLTDTEKNTRNLVELETGESYECDLLIGADGANSIVRKQMNDKHFYSENYNQMGVVATIKLLNLNNNDNSTAFQRFLPTGPVALLPLTNDLSSLVWSTSVKHAKELITMSPDDFVKALNEAYTKEYKKDQLSNSIINAFDSILGKTDTTKIIPPEVIEVKENSRARFPLGFGLVSTYVKTGAVLIGDAAHRVHPLAGQGVNLGFGDVQCLTNVLSNAVYAGGKLGDLNHLLKYEQKQLQHNVPVMLGIHGLQRIYNTDMSLAVVARSIGLKFVNAVPLVKDLFIRKAMA